MPPEASVSGGSEICFNFKINFDMSSGVILSNKIISTSRLTAFKADSRESTSSSIFLLESILSRAVLTLSFRLVIYLL